mgnify:CR=1 FL=1
MVQFIGGRSVLTAKMPLHLYKQSCYKQLIYLGGSGSLYAPGSSSFAPSCTIFALWSTADPSSAAGLVLKVVNSETALIAPQELIPLNLSSGRLSHLPISMSPILTECPSAALVLALSFSRGSSGFSSWPLLHLNAADLPRFPPLASDQLSTLFHCLKWHTMHFRLSGRVRSSLIVNRLNFSLRCLSSEGLSNEEVLGRL